MHKYVWWYCPNCGTIEHCFVTEQSLNYKCQLCSSGLKPTEVSCIEGFAFQSPRWFYDHRLIYEVYLKNELTSDKLQKIAEEYSIAKEEEAQNSYYVQWQTKYYQPKIDAWKLMLELGKKIEFDVKREYEIKKQLFDSDFEQHLKEQDRQLDLKLQAQRPKCPTCGSTNIKKISDLERGVSVGMWGLFSSKIGKTMKCNSCGHKW